MSYCYSKDCDKNRTCKKHIMNIGNDGVYLLFNYYTEDYCKNTFKLYEPIACKICGRIREIYAFDTCKSCYYNEKYKNGQYKRNYQYRLKGTPRGRKPKIKEDKQIINQREIARSERLNTIIKLRNEGKSFQAIGHVLGISKQAVNKLYNDSIKNKDKQ